MAARVMLTKQLLDKCILSTMKKLPKPAAIVIVVLVLLTGVVGFVSVRSWLNPPRDRVYSTSDLCEQNTQTPCVYEICDSTLSSRTMAKTCASEAKEGWVSRL
jgi:hypothetical protein